MTFALTATQPAQGCPEKADPEQTFRSCFVTNERGDTIDHIHPYSSEDQPGPARAG